MAMTENSRLGFRTDMTSKAGDSPSGTGASDITVGQGYSSNRRIWQRLGAIAIVTCVIPACVNTKYQTNAPVQSFVVSDEPRATAVGLEILAQGGRAMDAAAAMALAMTTTLPSRAGLAGGGVCVVFDAEKKTTRSLDFLPRPVGDGGVVGAPAMLRGIDALQANGGKLRWEQAVAPAEQLARGGATVSRAFATDLANYGSRLSADPAASALFRPNGVVLTEGATLRQNALADTLSLIRRSGSISLANGALSQPYAQAARIDPQQLRSVAARSADATVIKVDGISLNLPSLPETSGGKQLVDAWASASSGRDLNSRVARLKQSLGATGQGTNAPGAGLAVIDPWENSVACVLTMGAPFGTGRAVPGTGMLLAAPVNSADFGAPAVATTMIGRTLMAGGASAGGEDGPNAAAAALLGASIAAYEEQRGDRIQGARANAGEPGRVALINCQVSRENGLKECQATTDPRANGSGHMIETAGDR